jgi:AraC family transcriptional regulator
MNPKIETKKAKRLVGKRMNMSYADYKIGELWGAFMPGRKKINHTLSNDLISVAVYSPTHFKDFKTTNEFERWASVEVDSFDYVPDGMETFILPEGTYAIFQYIGTSGNIAAFYQDIFSVWLPNSPYNLDDRPHVEVLGEKYKNNDPLSEEEIWIPIKEK